jgi:hypothetical protein
MPLALLEFRLKARDSFFLWNGPPAGGLARGHSLPQIRSLPFELGLKYNNSSILALRPQYLNTDL